MYLCVYHRGGCVKSPRVHVLGWINLGTALQCFLPSSTVGGGRHSVRQRKDRRVSTSHLTSPAAADTASTWPGQVALSPMTSTGTGQQVCDNGAVTRRAEKDSAVGVRDVGEDRAGSVAWVSAIRDRAGRAIKANARQCHQDQWYGDSAGQCHQGQCYRDSAERCHQASCRGDGAGSVIAMGSTAGPIAGGFIPRPHPAAPHAWDPAGDLSVRAGRRRRWRGGVSQRWCGREGGSGWIDGL